MVVRVRVQGDEGQESGRVRIMRDAFAGGLNIDMWSRNDGARPKEPKEIAVKLTAHFMQSNGLH
jgi:hypothetical protein